MNYIIYTIEDTFYFELFKYFLFNWIQTTFFNNTKHTINMVMKSV